MVLWLCVGQQEEITGGWVQISMVTMPLSLLGPASMEGLPT